ncbi:MAG: hypothetical protein ACI4DY_07870, partial [Monoglobaceae bacterium]
RRRSGVERERLVCFSFASIFFCTSKENAQKRTIDIFIPNCRILNIKYKVVGTIHESPVLSLPLEGKVARRSRDE